MGKRFFIVLLYAHCFTSCVYKEYIVTKSNQHNRQQVPMVGQMSNQRKDIKQKSTPKNPNRYTGFSKANTATYHKTRWGQRGSMYTISAEHCNGHFTYVAGTNLPVAHFQTLKELQQLLVYPNTDVNKVYYDMEKGCFHTPLHRAICFQNIAMVKALVQHPQIDVNGKLFASTPLSYLVTTSMPYKKCVAIATLLIKHPKIDIHATIDGNTILAWLIEHRAWGIAALLIRHPAFDVNQKIGEHSVLTTMVFHRRWNLAQYLMVHPKMNFSAPVYGAVLISLKQWGLATWLLDRKDLLVNYGCDGHHPTMLKAALGAENITILHKVLQHPQFVPKMYDVMKDKLFETVNQEALQQLIDGYPELFKKLKGLKAYLLTKFCQNYWGAVCVRNILLESPLCKGNFECPICLESFQDTYFAFCANSACGGKSCLNCMHQHLTIGRKRTYRWEYEYQNSHCHSCRVVLTYHGIMRYLNHCNDMANN